MSQINQNRQLQRRTRTINYHTDKQLGVLLYTINAILLIFLSVRYTTKMITYWLLRICESFDCSLLILINNKNIIKNHYTYCPLNQLFNKLHFSVKHFLEVFQFKYYPDKLSEHQINPKNIN